MKYDIVKTHGTLFDLEQAIKLRVGSGEWKPQGGPFYDADQRAWCQAVVSETPQAPAGDIRLKEPASKRRQ